MQSSIWLRCFLQVGTRAEHRIAYLFEQGHLDIICPERSHAAALRRFHVMTAHCSPSGASVVAVVLSYSCNETESRIRSIEGVPEAATGLFGRFQTFVGDWHMLSTVEYLIVTCLRSLDAAMVLPDLHRLGQNPAPVTIDVLRCRFIFGKHLSHLTEIRGHSPTHRLPPAPSVLLSEGQRQLSPPE